MANIMKSLPLSKHIKSALIQGTGELSDYMKLICSYEWAEWANVSRYAEKLCIDENKLPALHLEALTWGQALTGA
jgi:c-di-GMP-related signal transduction protein